MTQGKIELQELKRLIEDVKPKKLMMGHRFGGARRLTVARYGNRSDRGIPP